MVIVSPPFLLSPCLPNLSALISMLAGCGIHHSSFLSKEKNSMHKRQNSGRDMARENTRPKEPGSPGYTYFHENYGAATYHR